MKNIYLDNAATTPIAPEVIEAMRPFLEEHFGNPSSTHYFGRKTKNAIELARRNIAKYLNCHPSEITFTSGGTEADNLAINCAVFDLGVEHVITSRLEHHAVLHTLDNLDKKGLIKIHYADCLETGHVCLASLEKLVSKYDHALVSLMHANNEIGNIIPIEEVAELCKSYNAYLHSDTVQTMGHYVFDLDKIGLDFATCAAHKFHGPKGVGFLYKRKEITAKPMIHGGSQERSLRGGTENVCGIIGMSKAFDLAYENLDEHIAYVKGLKYYMIDQLEKEIEGVRFNGDPKGNSLYTVLNVKFPSCDINSQILFRLDLDGIACSGGSACSSGSNKESHVLEEVGKQGSGPSIRFSFSRYNTKDEIDACINSLKSICTFGMENEKTVRVG